MLDPCPCPFISIPQNALPDENEIPQGQKKKKLKKIKFSLGGLISNQDHFGNLDEFNHIQDLLSITSSKVTMAIPRDLGVCLRHYNDQVMYGYNDEQLQLLNYFYHSANILGDKEDTFAHHH